MSEARRVRESVEGREEEATGTVGALLQHAVDEAARLLQADGAIVYLLDPAEGVLRWAHDAGVTEPRHQRLLRRLELTPGLGVYGRALAERRVVATGDYLADSQFEHAPATDRVARSLGIRSMIAAPLIHAGQPLGVMGVYSAKSDAFDDAAAGLIVALADHAAAAMANARLIAELDRSRVELASRAESERTLRDISAHLTTLQDFPGLLQRVVDDSKRLLGADGAHLTLVTEDGQYVSPVVFAVGTNEVLAGRMLGQRYPIGEGMNGLAAFYKRPLRTEDYGVDPRVVVTPEERKLLLTIGLRGLATAPLRAPDGGVIGTLTVTYADTRLVDDDAIDLLQGLADQAAIAVANARLYEEVQRSSARYGFLVQHSPDLVWAVDEEGGFTFLSETCERLTGWRPEELMGQHYRVLLAPRTETEAGKTWAQLRREPEKERRVRLIVRHRDRHDFPGEINAVGVVGEDGRFEGAHGSLRDMTDQDRLEQDLRRQAAEIAASDERAHLARELHDSVTQALFSMSLTTRSAEMLLERDPAAAAQKLAELRDLGRDALAEMRALIFELRPGSLAQDGLVQALRTHAAAVQGRTGLSVIVEADGLDRMAPDLEEALYRIAQEALHNTVKHASAHHARIQLARTGTDGARAIDLVVEDDGGGFDPSTVGGGHLGLVGMRSRAEQLGGRLEVEARPGEGTRILASLPLEPGSEHDHDG